MYTIHLPMCSVRKWNYSIVYKHKLRVILYAPVRKIPPKELLAQLHEAPVGHDHPQPHRAVLYLGNLEGLREFQAQGPDGHRREDAQGRCGLALSEIGSELGCRERHRGCGIAIMDPYACESRVGVGQRCRDRRGGGVCVKMGSGGQGVEEISY